MSDNNIDQPNEQPKQEKASFFRTLPFPLSTITYKPQKETWFDITESIAKNTGAGFILGSLVAWSKYTDPKSLAKNGSLSTPMAQEQLFKNLAKKGIHAATMAFVFTSTLEASKRIEFQYQNIITYSVAGVVTGITGALFSSPFQLRKMGKQALMMGVVGGLYAWVVEFNEERERNVQLAKKLASLEKLDVDRVDSSSNNSGNADSKEI